jgi:hypothetical protein
MDISKSILVSDFINILFTFFVLLNFVNRIALSSVISASKAAGTLEKLFLIYKSDILAVRVGIERG